MATPARRRSRRRSKADELPVIFLAGGLGLGLFVIVAHWLLTHLLIFALLATAAAIAGGVGIKERARRREQQRQWAWQQAQIKAVRAAEIATDHQMNARQFEEAVAYLCERDGCTQVQVVGKAGDLGADVLATAPDGRRIVLQCKRYTLGNQVSGPDLQKFGGTCYAVHQAQAAAVVTTSGFTKQARQYAGHMRIGLWDNDALAGWASRTGPALWM